MHIPTIETERLKLRAFKQSDLDSYAEMYADAAFVKYLEGEALSKTQTWFNMSTILGHWALLGYGIWAVESLETAELVGRAGLLNLPDWPDVEVCWAFSPKFWGRGFATEAARASIDWAFHEIRIHRLISLIHPQNHASESVSLRLGQTFKEQITFKGKPANVYEILNPGCA